MLLFPDQKAFERQNLEASFARNYLEEINKIQESVSMGKMDEGQASEERKEENSVPWKDEQWYTRDGICYTPDYAKGEIQCVLEIPSVKIRRGVYGGTWEEIRHDLDIWMVTAARPDYQLGTTHYCIYGHNHTTQNLSFNRLKDVQAGETFTLTSRQGVFTYQITRTFAQWREVITKEYVDNFLLDSQKCYIITCGRGENRYRDFVVEGELIHKTVKL